MKGKFTFDPAYFKSVTKEQFFESHKSKMTEQEMEDIWSRQETAPEPEAEAPPANSKRKRK